MPLPPHAKPVLPWEFHHRQHPLHPQATSDDERLYVLDRIGDDPADEPYRYCGFCGRYVHAHPAASAS